MPGCAVPTCINIITSTSTYTGLVIHVKSRSDSLKLLPILATSRREQLHIINHPPPASYYYGEDVVPASLQTKLENVLAGLAKV